MNKLFSKYGRVIVVIIVAGVVITNGPLLSFSEDSAVSAGNPAIELAQNAQVTTGDAGEKLISLDFQDVALKQILKIFSQQAGMNFVASESIQDKKVTLFMDKVSIEDALNTILAANGFILEKQPKTNIFMVKAADVLSIPLQTKIYKLNYATVSGAGIAEGESEGGIEDVIKDLISVNGKLIIDSRTNSLIVTDAPSVLTKIEGVLKELDVKTLQVMISAEIMEVSVDTLKRLGVEWGNTNGQLMTYSGGVHATFWPFKPSLFKGATETNTMGNANFNTFSAIVQAIKTDSTTQYLARPRLLTLNNRTAEMKITKNAAVSSQTVTVSQGGAPQTTTSLERYEVGTMLKVTPHINKDDYITLTIEPEVSRVKASSFGTGNYDPLKRSSKTSIMAKDGETIVIAGLISREDSDSNRKVPILGELPFVGSAFNSDSKQRSDTEILIFITTQIIKEEGAAFVAAMKQELGLDTLGSRKGEIAPGVPLKSVKSQRKEDMKNFHKLVREQDSPLSGKELMIEAEMLKIRSAAAVSANAN